MDTPAPANGSRRASSAGGNGADLFTAAGHMIAQARAGGLLAKHRTVKGFTEAFDGLSQVVQQFAQSLSEPDSGYPPAIWEPVAASAAHLKAASMAMGESDSAATALSSMQVGELAGSSVRAPHHRELNSDS